MVGIYNCQNLWAIHNPFPQHWATYVAEQAPVTTADNPVPLNKREEKAQRKNLEESSTETVKEF